MSAITLDYPLESLPGLPLQEAHHFHGYVQGGKVHVTFRTPEPTGTRNDAAKRFVEKWSGKGKLLPQEDVDADPRLAYLTAKHLH